MCIRDRNKPLRAIAKNDLVCLKLNWLQILVPRKLIIHSPSNSAKRSYRFRNYFRRQTCSSLLEKWTRQPIKLTFDVWAHWVTLSFFKRVKLNLRSQKSNYFNSQYINYTTSGFDSAFNPKAFQNHFYSYFFKKESPLLKDRYFGFRKRCYEHHPIIFFRTGKELKLHNCLVESSSFA